MCTLNVLTPIGHCCSEAVSVVELGTYVCVYMYAYNQPPIAPAVFFLHMYALTMPLGLDKHKIGCLAKVKELLC